MFLVIDYDQGCGGEKLCADLSKFEPCVKLKSKKFATQTKVDDLFANEFLRKSPDTNKIIIPQITKKVNLIPTHRHTNLLESLLPNLTSVRVQWPKDPYFINKAVAKMVDKVFLNKINDPAVLVGHVKQIVDDHSLKMPLKISGNKFILDYYLEAKGMSCSTSNRMKFIQNLLEPRVEPTFKYDYTIPYEYFYTNHNFVLETFHKIGIKATNEIFKPFV